MTFTLQVPGTEDVLQAIDSAALNAESGGGVFAFASKWGVETFFSRPNISAMLGKGRPFHMIVGIDAITNVDALLCLREKITEFAGALEVSVFYHEYSGSIFHPKFSWFTGDNQIKVITGSGNLTLGGLGKLKVGTKVFGNWEAFSVQTFKKQFAAVKKDIDNWVIKQKTDGTFKTIDDDGVRQKAIANARARFVAVATEGEGGQKTTKTVPIDSAEFSTPEVLIRELSKTRPGQADVGRAALKEFFGYEPGKEKTIFIQDVSLDNSLGPVIQDRLFVNASGNYRFELRAKAKAGYDIGADDSRIYLVATKLDNSSFRYTILVPNTDSHTKVSALLDPITAKGLRPMREARVTPEKLLSVWPDAPSNLLPSKDIAPEI